MEEKDEIININLKALFFSVWNNRWLVIGITLLFIVIGTFYAYTVREEFVSEGKILPEMTSGSGSSLGGLANLVGIGGFELGLKNNTEAIRPDLYPNIIQTTLFFLDLFEHTIITKQGDSLKFETYYHQIIEENESQGKDKLITFEGKPSGVIIVNKLTESRIKDLRSRINGAIDSKSGVISISAKMPDPVVAAGVARYSMNYLTEYVKEYRTEKSKREVEFLGKRVATARGEFYKDQTKKATYADQFSAPTIRLQSADIKRERLESEYKLSSTVYNELLKKYEEAKIKLQQDTPVFQVLEPPVAPNLKTEPKKLIIILFFTIIGLVISIAIVNLKNNKHVKIFADEVNPHN